MKKIAGVILFLLISSNSYAGNIQKAVVAGITYQSFSRIILPAVLEGKGIPQAISITKKIAKTRVGKQWIYDLLSVYIVTERDNYIGLNAGSIIIGAGVDDYSFKKQISSEMVLFDENTKILRKISIDLKRKYFCKSRTLIYDDSLKNFLSNVRTPTQEWDYGSYKDLKNKAVTFDKLEHDHIPSSKAVLLYLQKRDRLPLSSLVREKGIGRIIDNNATTLEVTKQMHSFSRTFKVKNNSTIYNLDSNNLSEATIKDFAYYYDHVNIDNKIMQRAFTNVYIRNLSLCLYE